MHNALIAICKMKFLPDIDIESLLSIPLIWFCTSVSIRDGSVWKICTLGGRHCKTVLIPGIHVLVHPKQTWTVPLHKITIKVATWTKYEMQAYHFFRFLVCSQYFQLYELTREIEVINSRNQNIAVLFNVIAITVKSLPVNENWGL